MGIMNKLLLFLLLLPFGASAQLIQKNTTYGLAFNRTGADTLFYLPVDTFAVPTAYRTYNFMARKATTLYIWNTSTFAWQAVSSGGGAGGWLTTGNTGTTAGTNFIGTTDAVALVVKTNNTERARVLSGGNVGIGTDNPTYRLHVNGTGYFNDILTVNNNFIPVNDNAIAIGQLAKRIAVVYTGNISNSSTIGLDAGGAHFSWTSGGLIEIPNVADPETPARGALWIYSRLDSLRAKNSAGTEFTLGTAGGGSTWSLTDSIKGVIVQATPNDGLEDSTAFKNAVATATAQGLKNIYVMPGEYLLNAEITLNRQNLIALGGGGVTIKTTSTSLSSFNVIKLLDSCMVDGFTFYGTGREATYATTYPVQNAIMIGGNANDVRNCRMRNMKGAGIYLFNSGAGSFYNNHITNIIIDTCTIGYYNNYYAQYTIFNTGTVRGCAIGFLEYGNNNSLIGVDFVWNDNAGYVNNGSGDDHGFITGCSFNHSNLLTFKDLQYGYVVTACQFFFTTLYADDADKVVVTGCAFGETYISVNGTTDSTTMTVSDSYATGNITYNIVGKGVLHKSGIIGIKQLHTEISAQDDVNETKLQVFPTKIVVPSGSGNVGIGTSSPTEKLTVEGGSIMGRWKARVGSTTSSATPTINTDNVDIYKLTAQAADITSFTTNLSGTPNDGDILEIQITGTAARAITWGSSFVSSTVTLPTTTVTTATLTVVVQYFTTSSYGNNKWVCVNSF